MIHAKEVGNHGRSKVECIDSQTYYIPTIDGIEHTYICENRDIALVCGLALKHLGSNAHGEIGAILRILKIESKWSK